MISTDKEASIKKVIEYISRSTDKNILKLITQLMTEHKVNNLFLYLSDSNYYNQQFAYNGINIFFNPLQSASITDLMSFKRAISLLFLKNNLNAHAFSLEELSNIHSRNQLAANPADEERFYNHIQQNMLDIDKDLSQSNLQPAQKFPLA